MNITAFVRTLTALTVAFVAATAVVSAQTESTLAERARELYAAADYEEAIALVGESQDSAAQQYRALSLLAIGRQADAEAAVRQLIWFAPEFTVSEEDVPPRFVALFTQQRREIIPELVRRLFTQARDDYRAKAYDRAVPQFKRVLALSSATEMREVEGVSDLRLLAESFLELASETAASKTDIASGKTTPASAKAVAATPVAATTIAPRVSAAVAIRQEMPAWPFGVPVAQALSGSVRVKIGADGRVTQATMVRRIDPRYDPRLIASARFWEFTPATENGVAVESEAIVPVNVRPTR